MVRVTCPACNVKSKLHKPSLILKLPTVMKIEKGATQDSRLGTLIKMHTTDVFCSHIYWRVQSTWSYVLSFMDTWHHMNPYPYLHRYGKTPKTHCRAMCEQGLPLPPLGLVLIERYIDCFTAMFLNRGFCPTLMCPGITEWPFILNNVELEASGLSLGALKSAG